MPDGRTRDENAAMIGGRLPLSDSDQLGHNGSRTWSSGMGRTVRWVLTGAVVLGLLLACVYLAREGQAVQHLLESSPHHVLLMTALLLLCVMLNGLVTRELVRCFRIDLRMREWFGITVMSSLVNLGVPGRAGVFARGVYLKQRHQLAYADFAGTLAATVAFNAAANGLLGAIGLIALGVPGGFSGWLALFICVSLVLGTVASLALGSHLRIEGEGSIANLLSPLSRGWRIISTNGKLHLRLLVWTFTNAVIHAFTFVLAFRATGADVSPWVAVTSSAFAKVGGLVAVTPAALGIFEAFGVVSAQVAGADLPASLLAVLLVRVLSILVTVVAAAVMWPLLLSSRLQGTIP